MIETVIRDVSVYRNGCVVRRTGNVHLVPGKNSVVIAGLSRSLDPSTVRLSLPTSVSGSNVQTVVLSADQKKEATRELKQKIADVDNRISILNDQAELWKGNADFSAKENLNIDEMTAYIEKLPERISHIQKQVNELNLQKEDLNRELKELNDKLAAYTVSVDMEAQAEGDYPLELKYYENNANWYPVYEVHTSENDEDITVRLRGKISQYTGYDWEGAKVTLYSGNPATSEDIPLLQPTRVRFYTPVNSYARAAMGGARMMAKAAPMEDGAMECEVEDTAVMDFEAPMAEVVTASAQVTQNDTMMEYELAGQWDVPNGKEIMADISEKKVAGRYHVVCVPKLADTGYLAAEVKTADIEELIDTNAFIYHKGTYLGEVHLSADMTKDTYDIPLGKDESVKLKRVQKKKFTSNVLLKGQKKTEYEYEIKVASAKNKPAAITLIDQVPLTEDKTIVIEKTDISGGEYNETTGEVKWKLDLQPSETKTFLLAYSIAWPKDKQLNI